MARRSKWPCGGAVLREPRTLRSMLATAELTVYVLHTSFAAMHRQSPIEDLLNGLAAGLVASAAQTLFFKLSGRIAPSPPQPPPELPEPQQSHESATQTVARRVVEDLAQRRPLENKEAAGELVHYAFGSGWGGMYGLYQGVCTPRSLVASGALFGLTVWAASDNLLLPAFKLSEWPKVYPLATHAYAVAAHIIYGVTVATVYTGVTAASNLQQMHARSRGLLRRTPSRLRPVVRYALRLASRQPQEPRLRSLASRLLPAT